MVRFKIINNINEIEGYLKNVSRESEGAYKDQRFNAKGERIRVRAGYQGHFYKIIAHQERTLLASERFKRGLLGTVLVICTLSLALFSEFVRELFTKKQETIYYLVDPSKQQATSIPLPFSSDSVISSDKPVNTSDLSSLETSDLSVKALDLSVETPEETPDLLVGRRVYQSGEITDAPKISSDEDVPIDLSFSKEEVVSELIATDLTPLHPIEKEFTPQMVTALGGIDKVLSFPIIDASWDGTIDPALCKAPIMRGYMKDKVKSPFLLFCYFMCKKIEKNKTHLIIVVDYLSRDKSGWKGKIGHESALNLGSSEIVLDGTAGEKYILDKITRLSNNKAVGALKKFSRIGFFKLDNKDLFRPTNAYLGGSDLERYMDEVDTVFYEKKPIAGKTDLFLYDPTISYDENQKRLYQKFPRMRKG